MIEFLDTSYGLRACLVGRQATSQSLCNFQESLCGNSVHFLCGSGFNQT
jgi:hypothetical protein